MFTIHSFSIMESGVLLAMSVDHFVPLYNPLLYNDILPHVAATSVILGMKSVAHSSPAFSSKASTFL